MIIIDMICSMAELPAGQKRIRDVESVPEGPIKATILLPCLPNEPVYQVIIVLYS